MGEDPRAAGTGVTQSSGPDEQSSGPEGQSSGPEEQSSGPEDIRREIETTREELGDTVAALAAKADVKAQAKQKVEDTKAAVTGKKDKLMGKAKQASPQTASTAATSVTQKAQENPVPVTAVGAFAFGFLAGWVMRR